MLGLQRHTPLFSASLHLVKSPTRCFFLLYMWAMELVKKRVKEGVRTQANPAVFTSGHGLVQV